MAAVEAQLRAAATRGAIAARELAGARCRRGRSAGSRTRRPLVDALAPEHLELIGPRCRGAGAPRSGTPARSSSGRCTPEVIGDYVGGPNHVLPTGRTARFASGLAVHDFLKRTTLLGCDARAASRGWRRRPPTLARAEGLEAHARAVERRLEARP